MNNAIDGFGVYGLVLDYAMIFVFVGSAFLVFVYLWGKGLLDMDEEAKMQMMQEDNDGSTRT